MPKFSKHTVAALIIWWCEGTKIRKDKRWKNSFNKAIEVTNCDPTMIRVFLEFLRKDMHVPNEKIRAQLQVHEGDNVETIEKYWQDISGIPKTQFNKTIIRKVGNKPGKNTGTFKVRVYGKELFDKLTVLLKEIKEEIIIGV